MVDDIYHQERWIWKTHDSSIMVELICDEKNPLRINPYFLFVGQGSLGGQVKISESDIRDLLDKLATIRENK